jgi:hypothetical protein
MKRAKAFCAVFLWLLPAICFGMLKEQYGGNIKIAEDLLTGLGSQALFRMEKDALVPLTSLPVQRQEASAHVDLRHLDADELTEIERWIAGLTEPDNSCHWILDFPFYDHQHPTTITVEGSTLSITTSEPEYLDVLLSTSCLLPRNLKSLSTFNRTQFGYEANLGSLEGRPFLDSITPVQVDTMNPYLSFKLNDVDIATIPEERFGQISADSSLSIAPGPASYLYFVTSGLNSQQVESLLNAIDPKEIARAVLNDHAEILLKQPQSSTTAVSVKLPPIHFSYPDENPYRLLAERLRVQWENKGITFTAQSSQHSAEITLAATPMEEENDDAFRYRLLARYMASRTSEPWFDLWERWENSGTIVPLLIHHNYIATRKNIQGLHTDGRGVSDFGDCWLLQ